MALITRKWTPEEFMAHEHILDRIRLWGYTEDDLSSDSLVNHILNVRAAMEERILAIRRNGPYF